MLNKKPKKPINIAGSTKKNAPGKGGGSDASRKTVFRKKPKLGTPKFAPGKGGGSDASRKGPSSKKKSFNPDVSIRLKRGGRAKKNVK